MTVFHPGVLVQGVRDVRVDVVLGGAGSVPIRLPYPAGLLAAALVSAFGMRCLSHKVNRANASARLPMP